MVFPIASRILFRDLKPSNVGFDAKGHVRLFDFGLAKELLRKNRVDIDAYRLTGATGSPRYMAPEVQLCLPYGKASDVYSFGILSWQVASLQTPYAKLSNQKLFTQVVDQKKRPARSQLSWLSRRLQSLVQECWAHSPNDRPGFEVIMGILGDELGSIKDASSDESSVRRVQQVLRVLEKDPDMNEEEQDDDDMSWLSTELEPQTAPSSFSNVSREIKAN